MCLGQEKIYLFDMKRKKDEPIIEIIGGTKEWRNALKKKLAKEIDPKSIHAPAAINNRRTKK